jgi:TDG/mug DNA glycosylase family protein
MDRRTIEVYQREAARFADRRRAYSPDRATAFAAAVRPGGVRLDLGCGPGHYLPYLGSPVVAADAAPAMLTEARRRYDPIPSIACDLEALPVRPGALAGVWASKCLQHIPGVRLPLALAGLHRALEVGGPLDLMVFEGEGEDRSGADDSFPDRLFTSWRPDALDDLLVGAGFTVDEVVVAPRADGWNSISARATRRRTLPDTVGPGMRLLMCGLNPSLYSADAGVGFARPGNRFWPAMLAAGLATVDRSPDRLLHDHGIGMTDVVKRATVAAAELTAAEYRAGMARVERLVAWLRPGAVCFVGLAGWRAAVDRRAAAGVQPGRLAGVPVYVMPSTSGLNAAYPLPALVEDLRAVAELAGPAAPESAPSARSMA